MEVSIVGLLLGAGYLMSKKKEQGGAQPGQGQGQGVRPSQQDVYTSTRWKDSVRRDEAVRAARLANAAADPANTGVVSPHQRALQPQQHSHAQQRVMASPQSMGGGGMGGLGHGQQQRVVISPLTGRAMELEEFKTPDMVPFFGGSVKQPSVSHSEAAYGGKLETFTGAFEHRPWGDKDATQALFQPSAQGAIASSGRPVHGVDDERAAYLASMPVPMRRNNEVAPGMEKELVGKPGVVGGTTGDVYYDSREVAMKRGLAPTVDDLRVATNPKVSYEGRVLPGAGIQSPIGARPDQPTVAPMRRDGPLIREIKTADDMVRTTGAVIAAVPRPPDLADIRTTNREQTTGRSSYFGSAGTAALETSQVRDEASLRLLRQPQPQLPQLPKGIPTAYATQKGRGAADDHGRASIQVFGNNRDITTVAAPVANLASVFKAIVMPASDGARTTRKETIAENEVPLGNLHGGAYRTSTYFDPETGVARTSIKETTLAAAPIANMRTGARLASIVYDPDEIAARTSRKETTLSEAPLLGPNAMTGRGTIVYDPEDWRPAPTLKQLITDRGTGNADGSVGGTTLKPTLHEGYDAPTTQREIAESTRGTAYGGAGVSVDAAGGYVVAQDGTVVRVTNREATSDHDHYGSGRAGVEAQVSYDAARVMRHDEQRELTLRGRVPTTQGVKEVPGVAQKGDSTGDPRQLAPDAAAIAAAPSASAVPPTLLRRDTHIRQGVNARAPPHDDEVTNNEQSDDRMFQSASSSQLQRQNNPYVLPPIAGAGGNTGAL